MVVEYISLWLVGLNSIILDKKNSPHNTLYRVFFDGF